MSRPPFFLFEQRMHLKSSTPERLITLARSRHLSVLTELAGRPDLPSEAIDVLLENEQVTVPSIFYGRMHDAKRSLFWQRITTRRDLTVSQQEKLVGLACEEPQYCTYTSGHRPGCRNEVCPRNILATNPSLRPEVVQNTIAPQAAVEPMNWTWFLVYAPLAPSQVHLLAMGGHCKSWTAMCLAINPSTPPELGVELLKRVLTGDSPDAHRDTLNKRLEEGRVPQATLLLCPMHLLQAAAVSQVIQDFPSNMRDRVWELTASDRTLENVLREIHSAPHQELSEAHGKTPPAPLSDMVSLRDRLERARTTLDAFVDRLPSDVALEVVESSSAMFAHGVSLLARLRALTDMVSTAGNRDSLTEAQISVEELRAQSVAAVEELERLAGATTILSLSQKDAPSTVQVRELVASRTMAFQEITGMLASSSPASVDQSALASS